MLFFESSFLLAWKEENLRITKRFFLIYSNRHEKTGVTNFVLDRLKRFNDRNFVKFAVKMAGSGSPTEPTKPPWPNTSDDYELKDLIGMVFFYVVRKKSLKQLELFLIHKFFSKSFLHLLVYLRRGRYGVSLFGILYS